MTNEEFYKKWINIFGKNIPQEYIEKYVVSTGNLIWHIFSWELLDKSVYLVGDEARRAYDSTNKQNAICIDWFENKCTRPLSCDLYNANALDNRTEIYVAAEDFSWTYIKTHEENCGPYFFKQIS